MGYASGGGAAGGGTLSIGVSTGGNTLGNTGVATGSQFVLAAGNGITLSEITGAGSTTISMSGITQSAQTASNVQALYDGAASISTGTVSLAAANGVTFSVNGQTVSGSVNTVPLVTVSRHWANSNGVAVSLPASNGSEQIFPLNLPNIVSFSRWDFPMSVSAASAATTATAAMDYTAWIRVFTRNNSTLNPVLGTSAQGTITWASNSSGWSNLTGGLLFSVPFAGTLAPNEYWAALSLSTHTGSSIGLSTTALGFSVSHMVASLAGNMTTQFLNIGDQATASSMNEMFGMQGGNSVAITNSTQQTIQQSNITMSGGPLKMYLMPVLRAT